VGSGSIPPPLLLLGFGLVLGTAVTDAITVKALALHHLFDFRPSQGFIFQKALRQILKALFIVNDGLHGQVITILHKAAHLSFDQFLGGRRG